MLTHVLYINDRYKSVKVIFFYIFAYILTVNDQRQLVKSHLFTYLPTSSFRTIDANW